MDNTPKWDVIQTCLITSFAMKAPVPKFRWLMFSLVLSGCGQHPRIEVTPGIESGRVVFRIAGSDINGLLGFTVMDGTNALWEVSTSYVMGRKIIYGVLPNGNMAPRQIFPAPGVAPASIGGKTVTVRVDYQYDRGLAACEGHFEKSMQIPRGEPDGPANRGQPLGSETNQTSAAAGPGG